MSAVRKAARPAYRLTRVVTPEDDLHCSVARALHILLLPPAEWTCFPAGNVPLTPQSAAKLARFGLARGWPDILICHRQLYGIELKAMGGRLSKTRLVRTRRGSLRELAGQVDVFPRLLASGAFGGIAVCRSVDEVLDQLTRWQVPLRAARWAA